MNLLTMEHITKAYTDRVLLNDVAFSINENEKIGVIGINGMGKSTLLKVTAGIEPYDEGKISMGKQVKICYLPQTPEFEEGTTVLRAAIADNVNELNQWTIEADARSMLNQLGFYDYDEKVEHMSGGQKKRIALVNALLTPADILILDEPTNHLDNAMSEWLEEYLIGFRGAILMVTHDRYFLDRVATRIVEVDQGKLYSYPGNYSEFVKLKAERQDMALATERKRKSLLRTELEWLGRGARARSTKQKAHIDRIKAMQEIKDIQALMTVSGGEVVYTKDTSEPTILWQGKPVTLLSGALIEQPGTIYASASDLAGNISAVLEQGEGTVTVTCGEQSAELPVKTVNGADYVPVRAFFEGIGYAVTWCPDSRTVSTSRMSTADTSEAAAQPPVDEYSFQLGNFDGTVGAFCDVIMTGAKELAFSDPFDPEDEPLFTSYVAKKCEGYGVKYYIDKDLLLTKLFSTVEMDGQWVYILYADDAVLQEYLELKQEEKDMIAAGTYTEKAQIDLATRYGKLMGYSDAHIAASIAGA